jgi:hypothetical protein
LNLRHLLKEYLELDDRTIDGFIDQFKEDWAAVLAQKLPDEEAANVLERLLGIPDWTKPKPV